MFRALTCLSSEGQIVFSQHLVKLVNEIILHSYMFRHYCVIIRELVINTLPSYTSISKAAFGNTIYN